MVRSFCFLLTLVLSASVFAQQKVVITCPECGHEITVSINVDGNVTASHLSAESNVPSEKMCIATTASGTRCSRKAQDGSDYCWQHANKTQGTAPKTTTTPSTSLMNSSSSSNTSGRCRATTKSGKRCSRAARSNGYCWQHGG